VLIADSTRTLLSDHQPLVDVGEFEVRGRRSGVRLWTFGTDGQPTS
jgi:class 3 adenylate cyclase